MLMHPLLDLAPQRFGFLRPHQIGDHQQIVVAAVLVGDVPFDVAVLHPITAGVAAEQHDQLHVH
ncbi:hypothetical protein CAI21_03630 [Alkalilimnicola ehrlichii]|nr:hypothetical protein CAI21_03630 [Alkalilimnicola ehrlichii]